MPSKRTVLSIIRSVVYAVLAVTLALWHAKVNGFADAILAGAVLGDYATWLVWSLMELPDNLLHGSYEAAVNLLFGVLLFRMANFNLGADLNGELMAGMFLSGLLAGGVKSYYLGIVYWKRRLKTMTERNE